MLLSGYGGLAGMSKMPSMTAQSLSGIKKRVSAAVIYAVLNRADANPNSIVSDDALTATGGGSGFQGVRATVGKSAGKWYYECTTLAGLLLVGLSTATDPLSTYPGAAALSVGYENDGVVYVNNNNIAGSQRSWPVGNVMGLAVDFDARLFWVATTLGVGTGSQWNNSSSADPVAGTGGLPLPGSPGLVHYPEWGGISGASGTMNFGKTPFALSQPSGFKPWTA